MVKIGKWSKLGKGRVNQWEGQVGGLAAPTWERASIARQSRLVLRLSRSVGGVRIGCWSINRSGVPVLALSLSNFGLKIRFKKIQFNIGPGRRERNSGSVLLRGATNFFAMFLLYFLLYFCK